MKNNFFIKAKNWIKNSKDKKLKKYAEIIHKKIKITANVVTLLSFICGTASVYFLFKNHGLFVILLFLSVFFDNLDGTLARMEKKKGKDWLLDLISDRIITLLILLKIAVVSDISVMMLITLFYMAVFTLVAYGMIKHKKDIKYVLMMIAVYGLIVFKFYILGVYLLFFTTFLSFIWIIPQLNERKK